MTVKLQDLCLVKNYGSVLRYMLKLQDYYQTRSEHEMDVPTFKDYMYRCSENYHVFTIKACLYLIVKSKDLSAYNACRVFRENGLKPIDVTAFYAVQDCLHKVKVPKVVEGPEDLRKRCDVFFRNHNTFIRKFVARKHRFITTYYGMDNHDIECDLRIAALRSAYKSYPNYQSQQHLENIMKRSLHNHGINLISTYNSVKNAVLVNDGTGYHSNLVSDQNVLEAVPDMNNQYTLMNGSYTIESLLKNSDPLRRKLIELITCVEDKEFIKWCNSKIAETTLSSAWDKDDEVEDTIFCMEDAYLHFGSSYPRRVKEYLKLTNVQYQNLMSSLEKEVA